MNARVGRISGGLLRLLRIIVVIGPAAVALPAAAQTAAGTALDVQRIIIEEASASRVPPSLALAVARVESNFQPRAESPVGAKGVMQLMPKTARDVFGVAEHRLWDARLNVRLGIAFLAQLYEQYGRRWDLALSHYNGGTLQGGSGPFAIPHEFTRAYVADVLRWQKIYAGQVFERPSPSRRGEPEFVPQTPSTERPWRLASAGGEPTARPTARAQSAGAATDRPWRREARFDPLEFSDWADRQQRRIDVRRERYADRDDDE